jgi:hypothetical protein
VAAAAATGRTSSTRRQDGSSVSTLSAGKRPSWIYDAALTATTASEEQGGAGAVFDFNAIAAFAADAVLARGRRSPKATRMPGYRKGFTAGDLKGGGDDSTPAGMADPVVGSRPTTGAAPRFD